MAGGTRKSSHDIFDCASKNMSIVGESSGERGTVIENVLWSTLTAPQLLFKSVCLLPKLEDIFFLWTCMDNEDKGNQHTSNE